MSTRPAEESLEVSAGATAEWPLPNRTDADRSSLLLSLVSSVAHPAQQPDAKKQRTDDMAANAARYTLWSYFRSGASYRVRIAMQHKSIPYKSVISARASAARIREVESSLSCSHAVHAVIGRVRACSCALR